MSNKYSLYVVIFIAALVGIIGFMIGRGTRELQVIPTQPVAQNSPPPVAAPANSGKASCDGRQKITQEDLFIKSSVTYSDGKGSKIISDDECAGTGLQVNKTYCYESPFGSGNFVPGKIVYGCQFGCGDGACRTSVRSDFPAPYPIFWNNDGINFSITGAAFTAAANLVSGGSASSGILTTDAVANPDNTNKITFFLKLENTTHAYKKPQITLRFLSNENGDLTVPAAERLLFPASDVAPDRLGPLGVVENQEVDFTVPANASQYEFAAASPVTSPGMLDGASSSGIFFTVGIGADGNIEIAPEATQG